MTSTVALPSGAHLPLLGLGTWRLTGATATTATAAAIAAGYRHVDTATIYGNEREVGAGLQPGVFVTTKLAADDIHRARATLEQSLAALERSQVDLWLQHWPVQDNPATWTTLLAAQQDGLAVDVGVSNYSLAQLDEVAAASGVMPAVNQIPWSPLRHDPELLAGHRQRGVLVAGYSGLRHGVLDLPAVTAIARRLGRTAAQVVIRWHLQHQIVVLPRSSRPERIAANAELVFELDAQAMADLDACAH